MSDQRVQIQFDVSPVQASLKKFEQAAVQAMNKIQGIRMSGMFEGAESEQAAFLQGLLATHQKAKDIVRRSENRWGNLASGNDPEAAANLIRDLEKATKLQAKLISQAKQYATAIGARGVARGAIASIERDPTTRQAGGAIVEGEAAAERNANLDRELEAQKARHAAAKQEMESLTERMKAQVDLDKKRAQADKALEAHAAKQRAVHQKLLADIEKNKSALEKMRAAEDKNTFLHMENVTAAKKFNAVLEENVADAERFNDEQRESLDLIKQTIAASKGGPEGLRTDDEERAVKYKHEDDKDDFGARLRAQVAEDKAAEKARREAQREALRAQKDAERERERIARDGAREGAQLAKQAIARTKRDEAEKTRVLKEAERERVRIQEDGAREGARLAREVREKTKRDEKDAAVKRADDKVFDASLPGMAKGMIKSAPRSIWSPEFTSQLEKAKKSLSGIAIKAREAASATAHMGGKIASGFDKASFAAWKLEQGIRLITGAAKGLGQIAIDAEGINSMSFAFDNASKKLGVSMEQLEKATGGTVSKTKLSEFANFASAAGVSGQAVLKFAERSRVAAKLQGKSIEEMFRRFIQGTAKQEKEILDEATVKVENATKVWAAAAKKHGKKPRDLTEKDKTEAYEEAVLRASEHLDPSRNNIPEELDNVAKGLKKITDIADNLKVKALEMMNQFGLLDRVGEMVTFVGQAIESDLVQSIAAVAASGLSNIIDAIVTSMVAFSPVLQTSLPLLVMFARTIKAGAPVLGTFAMLISKVAQGLLSLLLPAVGALLEVFGTLLSFIPNIGDSIKAMGVEIRVAGQAFSEMASRSISDTIEAMRSFGEEADAVADSSDRVATATEIAADKILAFNFELSKTAAAAASSAAKVNEYIKAIGRLKETVESGDVTLSAEQLGDAAIVKSESDKMLKQLELGKKFQAGLRGEGAGLTKDEAAEFDSKKFQDIMGESVQDADFKDIDAVAEKLRSSSEKSLTMIKGAATSANNWSKQGNALKKAEESWGSTLRGIHDEKASSYDLITNITDLSGKEAIEAGKLEAISGADIINTPLMVEAVKAMSMDELGEFDKSKRESNMKNLSDDIYKARIEEQELADQAGRLAAERESHKKIRIGAQGTSEFYYDADDSTMDALERAEQANKRQLELIRIRREQREVVLDAFEDLQGPGKKGRAGRKKAPTIILPELLASSQDAFNTVAVAGRDREQMPKGFESNLAGEEAQAIMRGNKDDIENYREQIQGMQDEYLELSQELDAMMKSAKTIEEFNRAASQYDALKQSANAIKGWFPDKEKVAAVDKAMSVSIKDQKKRNQTTQSMLDDALAMEKEAQSINTQLMDLRSGQRFDMLGIDKAAKKEGMEIRDAEGYALGREGDGYKFVSDNLPEHYLAEAFGPEYQKQVYEFEQRVEAIQREAVERANRIKKEFDDAGLDITDPEAGQAYDKEMAASESLASEEMNLIEQEKLALARQQKEDAMSRWISDRKSTYEKLGTDMGEALGGGLGFGVGDGLSLWLSKAYNQTRDWTDMMLELCGTLFAQLGAAMGAWAASEIMMKSGNPIGAAFAAASLIAVGSAMGGLFTKGDVKKDEMDKLAERELKRQREQREDKFTVTVINNGLAINNQQARELADTLSAAKKYKAAT